MLRKSLFLFAILFFLIISFFGYFYKKEEIPKETPDVSNGAWIEIQGGSVFLLENSNKKELFTGHTINNGDEIEVSADGKASVHLFDGSVIRADSGSRFVLKNAVYDKNSGMLTLEAFLFKGRIWSKIIELATPDSLWKIETSNTVATVRGSAFGIYTDGVSSEVIGSQHQVFVDLLDPNTKNKINKEPIIIEEDSLLKIDDKDIKDLSSLKRPDSATSSASVLIAQKIEERFKPRKKDEAFKKDKWLIENEIEDSSIEDDVKLIKNRTRNDKKEWKKDLNIKIEERFNKIKDKKENSSRSKNKEEDNIKIDNKPLKSDNEPQKEEVKKELIIQNVGVPEKWDELKIETLGDLKNVTEGEMIIFRALLKNKDGQQKDVTRESDWRVLGSIGLVSRPGTFAAKLDSSISEMGEGFGFVVAVWKNLEGKEFLGKSDEIHVNMKIDEMPLSEEMMMGQ